MMMDSRGCALIVALVFALSFIVVRVFGLGLWWTIGIPAGLMLVLLALIGLGLIRDAWSR